MSKVNQAIYHMANAFEVHEMRVQEAFVLHIGEDKESADAISKIPVGKVWREDHWENDDAYEEMIVAKTRLLKDYPFWGILSMGLRLVEDTSGYIPTLAVDGRHLFYSADFVMRLNRGERVYAVGHEIMHCLLEHASKSRSRGMAHADFDPKEKDPKKREEMKIKAQLWNFATDYIVNDDLVLGKVGDFITTIPILHDTKYRGWSSEEVYDHLLNNPEERPDAGQQFDKHIEIVIEEDGEGDGEGEGEGQPSNGNPNRVRMKRSDYEKMKKDWQENTMRAAAAQKEAEARGECAGSLPAGVQRLLDELTKPVVNWRSLLRRYVMQVMSYDYSFNRPNKALFDLGYTIPGFRAPHDLLDIVIAVDTSGSIDQEQLTAFVSEMDGIMKSFPSYTIKAWCFDGAVLEDSVCTIKKTEGTFEDIKKFAERVHGGGGTNFEVNWEYMKEEKIKPKLFLFLTDGMPFSGWGWPSYQTGFNTIFLIIGNPSAEAPKSIGMTIHYEDQQK